MNKNHEGYHDPTASKAVRRVCKKQKNKKKEEETVKVDPLTYCLDEVPAFIEIQRKENNHAKN